MPRKKGTPLTAREREQRKRAAQVARSQRKERGCVYIPMTPFARETMRWRWWEKNPPPRH